MPFKNAVSNSLHQTLSSNSSSCLATQAIKIIYNHIINNYLFYFFNCHFENIFSRLLSTSYLTHPNTPLDQK